MKLLNTAKLENLPQSLENIVFQIVDDMPQAKTELIETVNYTPTHSFSTHVYIVDNISPIDIEHNLLLPTKLRYGVEFDAVKANNMIAEHQYANSLVDMVKALHENYVLIVDKALRDLVYQAINVAKNIHKAYSANDIYKNICIGDKVQSILEWWYTAPNANALMEELVSDESLKAVETVFEKVLADIYTTVSDADKLNLMTQEEQIDTFLKFSKDKKANKHARMTDKDLEEFTESNRYQHAIKLLTDNGFRLSDTQQYNVKQSAIFFQKNRENYMAEPLFNLSDMGAGKTLMTVESMFLHDLWCVENNKNLESKGLIAPTLSIKSSWLETMELFYTVEKEDDAVYGERYALRFRYNHEVYVTYLYVTDFTVAKQGLFTGTALPMGTKFVIIDEIHQLLDRKIKPSRFFDKGKIESGTQFVILSGTLSNLTVGQWANYKSFVQEQDVNGTEWSMTTSMKTVSSDIVSAVKSAHTKNKKVDTVNVDTAELTPYRRNTESSLRCHYGAKLVNLETPKLVTAEPDDIIVGSNLDIIDTPNFQLFYEIVGSSAITANSQQVATELFGEQPDQHQSEIINLPSAMTSDDIVLLKTIYNIAKDYKVYRNRVLATTINNALLNLGDGLADNTIYDILSNAASKNVKFLEYLTSLDVEILEKLPQSQLIAKPNLTQTAKFKALTNILDKEKEETHLIVVNDYKAMKTLSQALNIEFMSEKETNDQANYQDILNTMFDKQSIVVVPQHMLKSSIDLVQANRLIQYQLNSDIADIIQTQNRINRIGQTRETKAYYIANDELQENIIELFLETYRNIKVAHKGIVELFVDMNNQVNVVNDYLEKALENM